MPGTRCEVVATSKTLRGEVAVGFIQEGRNKRFFGLFLVRIAAIYLHALGGSRQRLGDV